MLASCSAFMPSVVAAQVAGPDASASTDQDRDIIVTGSRIAGASFNAPTPVISVGEERIEKLAVTDIGEALNQLPSFRATLTPETTADGTPTNIAQRVVDLRGLGASRTLVLVDSRRFVPSNSQGTVDLNSIPTNLVKRVDVVTGGASAAYGADAVAGVVNFILDTKFTGIVAQASYGQAEVGDKKTGYGSIKAGFDFGGGRGHILIGGEYLYDDGTGDCFSRRWCRENTNVMANPDPSNGMPANLMLPNLFAVNSTNGLIISGQYTGTTFTDDGTARAFNYGQLANGVFMVGGDSDNGKQLWLEGYNLSPKIERYNGMVHLDYELNDGIKMFAEGSIANVYANSHQIPPVALFSTMSADYAYLPTAIREGMAANGETTFTFNRQDNDLGVLDSRSKDRTYRLAFGFSGDLSAAWHWDAYYQFGRHENVSQIFNNRDNAKWAQSIDAVFDEDDNIVCRSTLTNPTNGCVPVNLIGYGNWDPAVKQWAYGTSWMTRNLTEHVLAANVNGTLAELPAGALGIAAGFEYRNDKVTGDVDALSAANGWWNNTGTPISGRVEVSEAYLEAEVPLLRDAPFAKSLSLNGAVRQTHYNTSGNVTTWKIGAVWDINDALRVRGTRSRDIRAPNMDELFSPTNSHPTILVDPRDNSQVFVSQHQGGNTNLNAEKGDTWTVGVVLQPASGAFSRVRASVDYYDIKVKGAIDIVNPQSILDRCEAGITSYCQFVTRNTAGTITDLDVRYINLNQLHTNGVEFALNYRMPTSMFGGSDGAFEFNALANYVAHLKLTDGAGVTVDRAGQTGIELLGTPGQPHWSADGVVTYSQGPGSVTLQGHYVAKGIFDADRIGPDQPGYSVTDPRSINNNNVSARFYLNLAGQFDIIKTAAHTIQLFGAVQNLLDTQPPFLPGNHNPIFFDNIGRQYTLGVRVKM